MISLPSRPFSWARTARCWLRAAKASWSSREICRSVARFSAVCGMESVPNSSSIRRLTKRQPMEVSNICTSRPQGAPDLLTT